MYRNQALTLSIFLIFFIWIPPAASAEEDLLREIAPGIHVFLQPEARRFNDSNSVVVATAEGTVVIDSQANRKTVTNLIEAIRGLSDSPVRYLINTHWHGDHSQGNDLYLAAFPGLEIVGHESLSDDVAERAGAMRQEDIERYDEAIRKAEARLASGTAEDGSPMEEEEKQALPGRLERARAHVAGLRGTREKPPTLTYDGKLTLNAGGQEIELRSFTAHTRGDTVVYLPQAKILVTGDMLDEMPYAGHGFPGSWIRALDELDELEIEHIVPGHGPIFEGKEQLGLLRSLLQAALDSAADAAREGRSLEELQGSTALESFRDRMAKDDVARRNFDAFRPSLLERAYLEATGELE